MDCSDQMLESQRDFNPADDLDAWLKTIPAKWAVYLMSDSEGLPVQLLCVKNLRASLQRRLGDNEQIGPSRRVGYRDLVRKIIWRRVDSDFEADLIYLESARRIFPETYRGMLAFKEAWFLRVDPQAKFPRYFKTNDLTSVEGELVGPLKDKDAAGRLIELVEDAFDLCRYYNVLVESPHGRACAYKEMGRCPAPCDGSISMEQYHQMIRNSLAVLLDPGPYIERQEFEMHRAAEELQFERAAKIKNHLERVLKMRAGLFAQVRSISQFKFISLQRGPRRGTAKIWFISPTRIEELLAFIRSPADWASIVHYLQEQAGQECAGPIDRAAAERLAVVASHLFVPKKQGFILPAADLTATGMSDAYGRLQKQKEEPEVIGEGIIRDLQSL